MVTVIVPTGRCEALTRSRPGLLAGASAGRTVENVCPVTSERKLMASRRLRAFTLVELVVVVVLLGILASVAAVSYHAVVTRSQDAAATSELTGAARESFSLAALQTRSSWQEAEFRDTFGDSSGALTLGTGATSDASPGHGVVSLALSGADAGLAMRTGSGACALVRATLPDTTLAWTTDDPDATCAGQEALAYQPGEDIPPAAPTPAAGDVTPAAPTGLTAELSSGNISLVWNNVPDAFFYTVYRSADGGATWTSFPARFAGLVDTKATAPGTYLYQVSATADHEGPRSGTASVTR